MKLYLDKNIAKGTPEELAKYKELIGNHQLDKFKEVSEDLFSFGHMHEADVQEEDSMHDEGAFYTVTEEAGDSPLPVGTILQHQHGNLFIDSIGQRCRISRPSFVDRGSTHNFDDKIKQDRFELAKELGIKLTSSTDFAVETSDRKLKLKKDDGIFAEGELVKIVRDDNDRLPLVQSVEDPYRKEDFVYISKIEVVEDTFKGFFGSLMLDKSSIGTAESSTDEAQTPSRELKVGDRVKVLNSLGGAVGEATVTAVLEGGRVELAGNNKEGTYLSDWSNYISNVEKIEKPASFGAIQAKAYLEDKSIDQIVEEEKGNHEEDEEPTLEQYFEIIDNGVFRTDIKRGTILKKIAEKCDLYKNYSTSDGITQACSYPEYDLKQVDAHTFKDRFEFAEKAGIRLMTDTDFAEECKGHQFEVTDSDYLTNFEGDEVLTVFADDGSEAISFENQDEDVQFALLKHVREIARPTE